MKPHPTECSLCGGGRIEKITDTTLYGYPLAAGIRFFYRCMDCGAYVGCHPGTDNALGLFADVDMRKLRMRCHEQFDPIWRCGMMTRRGAYKTLANLMGIDWRHCHFSRFSKDELERALSLIAQMRREHDRH